jgi:hypothetical protein
MKVYRSGDSHQRQPILQPITSSGEARKQPPMAPQPITIEPEPRHAETEVQASNWTIPDLLHPARTIVSRQVRVPAWALLVTGVLVLLVPAVIFATYESGSDSVAPLNVAEAESVEEPRFDPPVTNEFEQQADLSELFSSVEFPESEWIDPGPPRVSSREQSLIDQGVNPQRLQVYYAAEDIERLQAELEAIQRNSAILRSLTRQQSGDLSMAYSSLEATQEQKEGALEDLQQRIDELEERIRIVDELARELRGVLGLPQAQGGMGGPGGQSTHVDSDDVDPWLMLRADIVAIEQWAGGLILDLDEVNTAIQLRVALVQQTGLPRGSNVYDDLQYYDALPLGWPVEGPVTSRFGMRASPFESGVTHMHTGIDIAARTGTPVQATGAGTVRISGNYGGYGLLVVIDHGRGVSTWYGHNSVLRVSPGQWVNAGDIIADVGSTGMSTGPHVHYEVRINNVPQDPLPLMQMSR